MTCNVSRERLALVKSLVSTTSYRATFAFIPIHLQSKLLPSSLLSQSKDEEIILLCKRLTGMNVKLVGYDVVLANDTNY